MIYFALAALAVIWWLAVGALILFALWEAERDARRHPGR